MKSETVLSQPESIELSASNNRQEKYNTSLLTSHNNNKDLKILLSAYILTRSEHLQFMKQVMPFFKLKEFPSRKKLAHCNWVTYPPKTSLYKIKSSRYLRKLKSNKNFVNKLRNDGPWCIGYGDLASATMMGFHLVCVMYARGSSKNVGIGTLCNLNGLSLISFLRPDSFKTINEVESSSLLIKGAGVD